MAEPTHSIPYGDSQIEYQLIRSRRRTLQIAVHPDKRVVVRAPLGAPPQAIEERVRKKAAWIKKQFLHFEQYEPRTPPRQYVRGESHPYLGRKYRLKIERASGDSVMLKGGYLSVRGKSEQPQYVKRLLEMWYQRRAAEIFSEIYDYCWADFDRGTHPKPHLRLRSMKTRWGSLSPLGRVSLNTQLIKTPRECIEYVVMHEFCHLEHANHGAEFYQLMDAVMPDWKRRKQRLEMSLI